MRTSISDIREELIQSSGSEPLVRLRPNVQGSDSNVVSVEQGLLRPEESNLEEPIEDNAAHKVSPIWDFLREILA